MDGVAAEPKRVAWTDAQPQLPGLPGPRKWLLNKEAGTRSWEITISSSDRVGDRFWLRHL